MATIYVKVGYDEDIRIRQFFISRRILATNNIQKYKDLNIPIDTRLKVSSKEFPGAQLLPLTGDNGKSVRYGTLYFCTDEFDKYFPKHPENLYWKTL